MRKSSLVALAGAPLLLGASLILVGPLASSSEPPSDPQQSQTPNNWCDATAKPSPIPDEGQLTQCWSTGPSTVNGGQGSKRRPAGSVPTSVPQPR